MAARGSEVGKGRLAYVAPHPSAAPLTSVDGQDEFTQQARQLVDCLVSIPVSPSGEVRPATPVADSAKPTKELPHREMHAQPHGLGVGEEAGTHGDARKAAAAITTNRKRRSSRSWHGKTSRKKTRRD